MALKTVQVADLDAEGVYWRLKDKAVADLASGDIVFGSESIVPEDRIVGVVYLEGGCDLPGGIQKWMPGAQRFEPMKSGPKLSPSQPSSERALYDLVIALRDAGIVPLPTKVMEWVAWYASTFEAPG